MKRVSILAVLLTAACASIEPVPFSGPSGKQAYSMRCSGMGRTLDACYRKAGEICPAGYNIVDQRTGTVGVPAQRGMLAAPDYRLAVECR